MNEVDYRAVIGAVTPSSAADLWRRIGKCYLSVSLGALNFMPPRFDATARWIAENFTECLILIGDSIHRLTLQVDTPVSEAESLKQAMILGELFLAENLSFFHTQRNCRFQFQRTSELATTTRFAGYIEQLMHVYETDPAFALSLQETATTFVTRKLRRRSISSERYRDAVQLSIQYLVEEMAVFACVSDDGWIVETYPGEEIPVLAKIVEGEFPGVPEPLRKRINIALNLRARKRNTP